MAELLVQQDPSRYRQLAEALQYQQPQQQQQQGMGMPSPPAGLMNQFMGGGGSPGAGGGGGGGGMSGLMSNPYAWLAAALAYKAYDTKENSGVSYEDQLKNISLAPQKDFDRWGLDKYAPFGGGDIYKSSFDLATGDFSNWWDAHKKALKKIF